MPLMPKRTKYRKPHRLYHDGKAKGNTELQFGDYGLQAKEGAWITTQQIEAARVAMTRYMKRGGKVWVNIFPHLSLTRKPAETRQGKGKGNPRGRRRNHGIRRNVRGGVECYYRRLQRSTRQERA